LFLTQLLQVVLLLKPVWDAISEEDKNAWENIATALPEKTDWNLLKSEVSSSGRDVLLLHIDASLMARHEQALRDAHMWPYCQN
jgi:hypothetical protein